MYGLNTRAADVSPMSDQLKAQLRAEFAPEVRRLAELIGRDLSAWLPKPADEAP